MLNRFRSFSGGIVTKLLIVLLVLSFALWGVADMLRAGSSNPEVAKVGSKTIHLDEYRRTIDIESANLQRSLGANYSPEILKQLKFEQYVLQNLVQKSLLAQEAEKMGFVPSDVEVAQVIRSNPLFSKNGSFDKAYFQNYLGQQGMSERSYVEQLRSEIAASQLMDALAIHPTLSTSGVNLLLAADDEARNISLFRMSAENAGEVGAPKDGELQAYLQKHAETFTTPEYRTASYISFSAQDVTAKNVTVSDQAISDYYDAHLDQFRVSERREVEQLLYTDEAKASKAYAAIKAGEDFAKVVKDIEPLNRKSISLGLVEKKGFLEGAADKVFALKSGEVTEPVKSPFGYHVFRVVKIEAPTTLPLEKVKPEIEKGLRTQTAENSLTQKTNALEDALAGGSTMKEAASSLGLSVKTVGAFNHQGKTPDGAQAKDIPQFEKFIETVFATDQGSESSLISTRAGIYYVVHVDSVTPEKLPALADIKKDVLAAWTRSQQQAKLSMQIGEISSLLAKPETQKTAIDKFRLRAFASGKIQRRSTALGEVALPMQLVRTLYHLPVGQLSQPVREKNGDYLLARVDSLIAGDAGNVPTDKVAAFKKELGSTMENEIMTQYMRHLQNKYPVKINDSGLKLADSES